MILVQIVNTTTSRTLLKTAYDLSAKLDKKIAVLWLLDSTENEADIKFVLKRYLSELELNDCEILVKDANTFTFDEYCDEVDASFLFVQLVDCKLKLIRKSLSIYRNLRIPYMLFKDSFAEIDFKNVILPIGFLEEELEKAQFASAFGRFCNSKIVMFLANDYGSKASANANKMKDLFDKFNFEYVLEKATKDSFKVELEAVDKANKENAGIIIISTSRDYGLDDLIFGPKEYHVLRKSQVPVLLVNPRGDLYALCD